MKKILAVLVTFLCICQANAQAGISVSPGRMYFKMGTGASSSQFISVTNPTEKDLEIGVSFSDWQYEPSGNNVITEPGTLPTSCVDWIQILPASYFVLKPGETKQVEVLFKVPADADTSVPVHTAMVFFTQLNPGQSTDQRGAAIQVTVRMGVKVYHSFLQEAQPAMDFVDFTTATNEEKQKVLELKVENQGQTWADGKIKWELFNNSTGKKSTLPDSEFYSLPKDIRVFTQLIPAGLEKGNYTVSAILTYGENDVIKIAELDLSI